jgi:hypothetical protein
MAMRKGSAALKGVASRRLKHLELETGGWVDLTKATRLCRWIGRDWNVGRQWFELYRTPSGTLILKVPVATKGVKIRAYGLPVGPNLTLRVKHEYKEVSVAEAIALMAANSKARKAKRLFPKEFAEHEVRVRDQER